MDKLEQEYRTLDKQIAVLESRKNELKGTILSLFEKNTGHTTGVIIGGLQRVISVRTTYDVGKLSMLLSSAEFMLCVKPAADNTKIKSAIQLGKIKGSQIAPACTTTETDTIRMLTGK